MDIISLGAGVQSSTMALMAAHGEITPMPDCAIFADTGAEPEYVYKWLDWLEEKLPYPVYRVMQADGLESNIIESVKGKRFAGAPFFTESNNGGGMLRRQCTNEFKIQPLRRKVRELLGIQKGGRGGNIIRATQWIGISLDESHRMKPSMDKYIKNIWPLIDKKMVRRDCLNWMKTNGYPEPAKSSCYFCPYHDNSFWRDLKNNHPDDFEKAIKIDNMVRDCVRGTTQRL